MNHYFEPYRLLQQIGLHQERRCLILCSTVAFQSRFNSLLTIDQGVCYNGVLCWDQGHCFRDFHFENLSLISIYQKKVQNKYPETEAIDTEHI